MIPPPAPVEHQEPYSYYLTMRDGVRLAVDVWRPNDAERRPALLRLTRYWRGTEYRDPAVRLEDREEALNRAFVESGFVVVAVDARGTGASFGVSSAPWAEEEIADYREVVDWVVAQDWARGDVVAFGISYDANTAMLVSAIGHPALKAAAPLFPDFDPYTSIARPGGVLNVGFVGAWDAYNHALDNNDACTLAQFSGVGCAEWQAKVVGPRPAGTSGLAEALAEHRQNVDLVGALAAAPCRDDPLGELGPTMDQLSPFSRRAHLGADGPAWLVRAGWLDANTVTGVLSGYASLSNPQRVIIGAVGHAGIFAADPLAGDPAQLADPPFAAQLGEVITFLHETLGGRPVERSIRYQLMGSGAWRETREWPPAGTEARIYYLGGSSDLLATAPSATIAPDRGVLAPSTTTGTRNRWLTPLDAGPVVYGPRPTVGVLSYTSAPLEEALELAGDPSVTLFLASTVDSPIFVYLEAVPPGGQALYLSEGLLALEHRRPGPAPFAGPEVSHSFRRADLSTFVADELMELSIPLAPFAAAIPAGYRLRITVAGADVDTFGPPNHSGMPVELRHDRSHPSRLVLPVQRP